MSEYLDGDLASSGRERVERHVGECHDCRTVLGELRLMIERLGRLPSPDAGGAVRITAAVRLRLREPPRS
jgi:anti-sigma factor RsiW